nr:hypothetical protein GCM10020063_099990 [Dactylosporangium thailandense]
MPPNPADNAESATSTITHALIVRQGCAAAAPPSRPSKRDNMTSSGTVDFASVLPVPPSQPPLSIHLESTNDGLRATFGARTAPRIRLKWFVCADSFP